MKRPHPIAVFDPMLFVANFIALITGYEKNSDLLAYGDRFYTMQKR
jgi:hypothetical protein